MLRKGKLALVYFAGLPFRRKFSWACRFTIYKIMVNDETLQKEFRSIDTSWTAERLSLQIYYESEGKKKDLKEACQSTQPEEGEESLAKLRRKIPKTLPLAYKILRDRMVQFRGRQLHMAGLVGLLEDYEALQAQKNLDKCVQYNAERSVNRGAHLLRVWQTLCTVACLILCSLPQS